MNMIIKNSVFDGTLLEGFPITFQWRKKRPKNIYYVGPNGVHMRNYDSWYAEQFTETKNNLRRMFMHDFGHMMLYARRGDLDKLKLNNFGLIWETDWDTLKLTYHRKETFIDEVRIIAFEWLINALHEKGSIPLYQEYIESIYSYVNKLDYYSIKGRWNPEHIKERYEIIKDAYDFWIKDFGIEGFKHTAEKIKLYLISNL